jgi:predicted nucleotidyltransferase component of viral defense system
MNRKTINIAESIRARLLSVSRRDKINFNTLLVKYFQERFLYRISISYFKNNFLLKGALLFLSYNIPLPRPTKDIDLLGQNTSNNLEDIKHTIKNIANITFNDGVQFDPESITVEEITEDDNYPGVRVKLDAKSGVRVKLDAKLGNAKSKIQIDIGFGDIVFPEPVSVEFPVLLDFPAPVINTYTPESAIAEKFEAIVKFNFLTSRMKDFYDIWFMAKNHKFQLVELGKAIKLTFENRRTDIEQRKIIYTEEYKKDKEKSKQWQSFITRNKLEDTESFLNIVSYLYTFLEPACQTTPINQIWIPDKWYWIQKS